MQLPRWSHSHKGRPRARPHCQASLIGAAGTRLGPRSLGGNTQKFLVIKKYSFCGHLSLSGQKRRSPSWSGAQGGGLLCRIPRQVPPSNVRKARGGNPAKPQVSHGGRSEACRSRGSSRGGSTTTVPWSPEGPVPPSSATLRPRIMGRRPLPLQWGWGSRAAFPHLSCRLRRALPSKGTGTQPVPLPRPPLFLQLPPSEPRQPQDSQVGGRGLQVGPVRAPGSQEGVPVSPAFLPFPGGTQLWAPPPRSFRRWGRRGTPTCPGQGCPASELSSVG